ncbi:hypothetical protein [Mesorhizobium sp. CA7]|uniref:hypothetical protein n=1 Tax=Mesorhizobium sp. CA7 TaxID=588501 RepID=UPI001CC97B29|nr:hypothetical protein [Mesorhizobium sp. CA7]MBZ9814401.1 hypothetical protein [Mesorhizobium sp. CA7]
MLARRPGDAYFPEQDITAAIFALGFTAIDPVAASQEALEAPGQDRVEMDMTDLDGRSRRLTMRREPSAEKRLPRVSATGYDAAAPLSCCQSQLDKPTADQSGASPAGHGAPALRPLERSSPD